ICIVVAVLGAAYFISHQQHWCTDGQHVQHNEVFDLTAPQRIDPEILYRPFGTTVPTQVVVHAIAIALAILFIVLLVVRDQIVEGETIMTGYEIDTLLRFSIFMPIYVGTA